MNTFFDSPVSIIIRGLNVLNNMIFFYRSDYTALRVALPPKQEHVIMVRMSTIQEAVYRKFLTVMQESYGDQLNPIRIFAVCSKVSQNVSIVFLFLSCYCIG